MSLNSLKSQRQHSLLLDVAAIVFGELCLQDLLDTLAHLFGFDNRRITSKINQPVHTRHSIPSELWYTLDRNH